jgi:hypothetical protein
MTETTSEEPEVQTKSEDVALYNIHDGLRGRDGGNYLDLVEMEAAEVARAKAEGREPDFTKLQPTAGVPLTPISQVPDNTHANPSMANNTALDEAIAKFKQETAPESFTTVNIVSAVEPGTEEEAAPAPVAKKTASSSTSSSSSS